MSPSGTLHSAAGGTDQLVEEALNIQREFEELLQTHVVFGGGGEGGSNLES